MAGTTWAAQPSAALGFRVWLLPLLSLDALGELMRCFENWRHMQLAPESPKISSTPIGLAGLQAHRDCCEGGAANKSLPEYSWIRDPVDQRVPVGLRGKPRPRRRGVFKEESCWPDALSKPNMHHFFNPTTCCYRAFPAVSAMIAGFPKCATSTMLRLLARHPEIAADEYENDALTEHPRISWKMVSSFNFALRQLMLTKPSSRLTLLKSPMQIFDSQRMQRLAQIPGLKVIVMLREPTRWLHSFYNFFVEDCARNRSVTKWCCKERGSKEDNSDCKLRKGSDEIPHFWRDVVQSRRHFGRIRITWWDGLHSFFISKYVLDHFNYEDVAFVDSGIFRADPKEAVAAIQRLLKFLRVGFFEETVLMDLLAEFRRSLGGHALDRVERVPWRARLCPASEKWRKLGYEIYHDERKRLFNLLHEAEREGATTLLSKELFTPPCPMS